MPAWIAVLFCFLLYLLGYRFYARFLSGTVLSLRTDAVTPAHAMVVGLCITLIAGWLAVEAVLALRRYARGQRTDDLDIPVTAT